ncbi:MAG: DUF721 domain-containing protein [Actinomycetota bacterium]|nr:DUF721 domain-containing protein [Actinomycetota bacterium]
MIEGAVERLGPHHGGRSPRVLALAEVVSHWEEIAGPGLAPHVRPLKLEGSTLVVAADHSARATQVRLLGAELIGRLRQATGEAGEEVVVDEVRVVVRPPS